MAVVGFNAGLQKILSAMPASTALSSFSLPLGRPLGFFELVMGELLSFS